MKTHKRFETTVGGVSYDGGMGLQMSHATRGNSLFQGLEHFEKKNNMAEIRFLRNFLLEPPVLAVSSDSFANSLACMTHTLVL